MIIWFLLLLLISYIFIILYYLLSHYLLLYILFIVLYQHYYYSLSPPLLLPIPPLPLALPQTTSHLFSHCCHVFDGNCSAIIFHTSWNSLELFFTACLSKLSSSSVHTVGRLFKYWTLYNNNLFIKWMNGWTNGWMDYYNYRFWQLLASLPGKYDASFIQEVPCSFINNCKWSSSSIDHRFFDFFKSSDIFVFWLIIIYKSEWLIS